MAFILGLKACNDTGWVSSLSATDSRLKRQNIQKPFPQISGTESMKRYWQHIEYSPVRLCAIKIKVMWEQTNAVKVYQCKTPTGRECRPACLRVITGRTHYLVYFIPSPEPGAALVSPSSLTSQSSACRSRTFPLSICSQGGAVQRHGQPAGGGRLEGAGLRVCDHRRLLDVDAERRPREVAAWCQQVSLPSTSRPEASANWIFEPLKQFYVIVLQYTLKFVVVCHWGAPNSCRTY